MNDVTSFGDGWGGESCGCAGETDWARARVKVCLRDANFVGVTFGGGEDGRLDPEGLGDTLPVFGVGEPGARLFGFCIGAGFFLAPNDRRKDHSDSNCTESNSLDRGE